MDEAGKPVSRIYKLPTQEAFRERWRRFDRSDKESVDVEYPGRDAVLVRKQFVKGMNYFDERFGEFWADADLAVQIRRGLKKIRLYPSIQGGRHAEFGAGRRKGCWRRIGPEGAAAFIGKYYGFMGGLGFRVGAISRLWGVLISNSLWRWRAGRKSTGRRTVKLTTSKVFRLRPNFLPILAR